MKRSITFLIVAVLSLIFSSQAVAGLVITGGQSLGGGSVQVGPGNNPGGFTADVGDTVHFETTYVNIPDNINLKILDRNTPIYTTDGNHSGNLFTTDPSIITVGNSHQYDVVGDPLQGALWQNDSTAFFGCRDGVLCPDLKWILTDLGNNTLDNDVFYRNNNVWGKVWEFTSSLQGSSQQVPEPVILLLFLIGGLGMVLVRHGHSIGFVYLRRKETGFGGRQVAA